MSKPLKRVKKYLFFQRNGLTIEGPNPNLKGDCSGLSGNCSDLKGDCTGLEGNCTHLRGDCTGLKGDVKRLWGDCTGLEGDCTGLWGDCSPLSGNVDKIPKKYRPCNINDMAGLAGLRNRNTYKKGG